MRRRLVVSAGILLGIGIVALGVFQYRWITTAARADETEARRNMMLSAYRVIDAANDEVRTLMAFVDIPVDAIENDDATAFSASLHHWKQNTAFPALYEGAYLLVSSNELSVYRLNDDGTQWVPVDPEQAGFEPAMANGDEAASLRASIARFLRRNQGQVIVPLTRVAPPRADTGADTNTDDQNRNAVLQMQLNTEVFAAEIVPYYAELLMPSYLYRVTREGETLWESDGLSADRTTPDLVTPLALMQYAGLLPHSDPAAVKPNGRLDQGPRTGPDHPTEARDGSATEFTEYGAPSLLSNPVIRYWYFNAAEDYAAEQNITDDGAADETTQLGPTDENEQPARTTLEVYHADRSIDTMIRVRTVTNVGISMGLLSLVALAFTVLFRLYDRTERLRAREKEFVSSITHELRTPLSVIGATTANLADGVIVDEERTKRYARLIQNQVTRLNTMVESSLLYSQLELRSGARPKLVEFDPKAVVEDVVRNHGLPAQEAGASITMATGRLPPSVLGDPSALRLIAENLLINAIRHGTRRTRPDDDTPQEIRLHVRFETPQRLYVTVEDDGPGIPEGEQQDIFKPFHRGTASHNDQRQGSGLGLHLVARIAKIHDGDITVESPYSDDAGTHHQGARFTAYIRVNRGTPT